MRIAFVDIYKRIPICSGGDWWFLQLLTDLSRKNSVTTFYTFERGQVDGYQPDAVAFMPKYFPSRVDWSRAPKWLEILRPDFVFDKSPARDIKADVVFTLVYGYHIAAYIAKENRAPVVLVMHNVEWQYVKNLGSLWYAPLRTLENYILSRVDAIITISKQDYDYAVKHTSRDRVFYIPPRPDPRIFNPDGPRYDFGSNRFNCLFYGSLDRYQNQVALGFIQKELIPALARQGLDGAVKVHVFGSGKMPRGLCSETKINFIGAVNDPGPYIRGADAIIVPIKNPSGIKLRTIESLACGKPVVSTSEAVQGLPERLKAMIYVADTADDFARVLKRIRDGVLPNKANPSFVLRSVYDDDTAEAVKEYALTGERKKATRVES